MWLRAHLESSHFPRRVLVVEPLRSECSRLCNILTAGEMEVYAAGDLISAVHAVASFQPDLILRSFACQRTVVWRCAPSERG